MEGIQVNIDKEAIEKKIVQAIIDSSIGAKIEKGVQEAMKGKWHGDDPIQKAVNQVISESIYAIARQKLQGEFLLIAEQLIREQLTKEVVLKIIDSIFTVMLEPKNG